jgi:Flp pilus assembly protein TadG
MSSRSLLTEQSGSASVETALVLPLFVILLVGIISTAQLAWAVNSLHHAVQEAARCSAVNAVTCGADAQTVAFAKDRYSGPDVDATYAVASSPCGQSVTVSGEFSLNLVLTSVVVPIGANACFPSAPADG